MSWQLRPLRIQPPALLVVAALAMTLAAAAPNPLRAIVSLPIALLAPGGALVFAARGRRGTGDAGTQLALAVVLSFAVWALLALTLYVAGVRLETRSVVAAGDAVILAGALVAALRGPARERVPVHGLLQPGSPLALAAIVGAAAVIVVGLPRLLPAHAPAPYSDVSLAGDWARVDAPIVVAARTAIEVPLHVENHTGARRDYVLSSAMIGADWPSVHVSVPPGGSWTGVVKGSVPGGGCLHRLAIAFRRADARVSIGTLTLWFQTVKKLPQRCTP